MSQPRPSPGERVIHSTVVGPEEAPPSLDTIEAVSRVQEALAICRGIQRRLGLSDREWNALCYIFNCRSRSVSIRELTAYLDLGSTRTTHKLVQRLIALGSFWCEIPRGSWW